MTVSYGSGSYDHVPSISSNLHVCLKGWVMLILLLRFETTPTLVSIGDAIASFLIRPDTTTFNARNLDRKTAVAKVRQLKKAQYNVQAISEQSGPRPDEIEPRRWASGANRWQWMTVGFIGIVGVSLAFFGALITVIVPANAATESSPLDRGGAVTPQTVAPLSIDVGDNDGVYLSVAILLANLPQIFLSMAYLIMNGMLTIMLLSHEHSEYAVKRQYLRVTTPTGRQRSSYWLHLPFLYSIPFLGTFVVMHWLLSESLFIARIQNIYS